MSGLTSRSPIPTGQPISPKRRRRDECTRILAEFKKLASGWRANARKTQDNFVAGIAEQFACALEETIARLEK